MKLTIALCSSLFFSLYALEANCQSASHVSFMGLDLADHSYIDFGKKSTDCIQCHTDVNTCCSSSQGPDRGDWYFPNGSRLPFEGQGDIFERRADQRVDLCRRVDSSPPQPGIYRCDIPIIIRSGEQLSVHVGVYGGNDGGNVVIPGGLTWSVGDDSRSFILTCISTGGPATTVTWTRDSTTVTQGNQTVLNDPVTALYTHTLTVTGALGGVYTCTVANNKPSRAAVNITIGGIAAPTNVRAVQEDPTSILVSWAPSIHATCYRILYTTGGNSYSVKIAGGSSNTYILTGLKNGETYSVSIFAIGQDSPSETVAAKDVGLVPNQPRVSVQDVSATSISLSWSVPSDSVVTSYEVVWQRDTSGDCPIEDQGSSTLTGGSTSHDLLGLEESSRYTVTLTASNEAGSSDHSDPVTETTDTAAPSAPPGSIVATIHASTSIGLHWEPVECIHRNGRIVGHSVRYEEVDSGSAGTQYVPGGSVTQTTILELKQTTEYSIQVAAVNSVGTGVYSEPVTCITRHIASSPTDVRAIQEGVASIRVSWIPPSPLGDTIGYSISFTAGNNTSTVNISGGSSDGYHLTSLTNGVTYSVTITALSKDLPSNATVLEVTLVPLPGQPTVSVNAITATSISLSWSIPSDSVVTSYEVVWEEAGTETGTSSERLNATKYTIKQLDFSTIYNTTVGAKNIAGTTNSLPIIISTIPDSTCDKAEAIIIGGVVGSLLFVLATAATTIVAEQSLQS
ncbi:Tyrosine-protein phosphatase Lar [Geodia barretti]|uniref:Tyrosine-protein phosphatase Lar n=1 Tax=Geodia barretti TaxID=519541 RepID=A0AA35QSE5_GEOBA|nr:Tyrosine-protein phosphatase Lar [Geodia barretti]